MKRQLLTFLMFLISIVLIGCNQEKTPTLAFEESNMTVFAFEPFSLTPTIANAKDDIEILYSIGDTNIIQITDDGFMGRKAGSTMIIASLKGVPGTTRYIFVQVVSPNEFRIDYVLNGGGISINSPISYTPAQLPLNLPRPVKHGFVFVGWYETPDFSDQSTFVIPENTTQNKTYYAKWE